MVQGESSSISSVIVSIIKINRNGLSLDPWCNPTSLLTFSVSDVFLWNLLLSDTVPDQLSWHYIIRFLEIRKTPNEDLPGIFSSSV